MRYPRRKFKYANRTPAAERVTQAPGEPGEVGREPEAAPAA
jgi:hypothetical protein